MSNAMKPFGKKGWTPDMLPDVTGKTYIITGGNSGLGFEAAKHLSGLGARVVILCRNEKKAAKAVDAIKSEKGDNAQISYRPMDLADLASVRSAAASIVSDYPEIHGLLCNAGLMMIPRRTLTKDGFEMQIGVNHFGHFVFAQMLFDNVERVGGRFVSVSSIAHRWGMKRIAFEDISLSKRYTAVKAYGQSKLANMLYVHELERRLRAGNRKSSAYVCHPGYAATNLQTTGPGFMSGMVMRLSNLLVAHSAFHGAKSLLLTAAGNEAQPVTFYGPTQRNGLSGPINITPIHSCGTDMSAARRLWEYSEELTGASWPV